MAKIYETQEDITREGLSNEVRNANSDKRLEFNVGIGGTLIGLSSIALGDAEKELKEVKKTGDSGKFSIWIGVAFLAASAFNFALSFFDGRKAKKAKKELDALGPQQIVVPENSSVLPAPVAGKAEYRMAGHVDRLNNSREADPAMPLVKS